MTKPKDSPVRSSPLLYRLSCGHALLFSPPPWRLPEPCWCTLCDAPSVLLYQIVSRDG